MLTQHNLTKAIKVILTVEIVQIKKDKVLVRTTQTRGRILEVPNKGWVSKKELMLI